MDRTRRPQLPPAPRKRRRNLTVGSFVLLTGLLIFPVRALVRLGEAFDLRTIGVCALLISLLSYLFYWHDKRRAVNDGWRTPESTLHLLELLGGWPGAFLAQRKLRHKIVKPAYQVRFWMIVAAHEYAAFDFVQGWFWSRSILRLLEHSGAGN